MQWVKQELQKPKYGGYWLCKLSDWVRQLTNTVFSNVLTKGQIEEMASVDEFEVVKEVQVSCDSLLSQLTTGILCGLPGAVPVALHADAGCTR